MHQFTKRYENDIRGTLSGFDRIRFRGTIRWFGSVRGVMSFLHALQIRLTNFKAWAMNLTKQIVDATEHLAEAAGRPVIYLPSSSDRKDALALKIAQDDGVTEGLICVFKCVEPCHTFTVGPNRNEKKLELRKHPGKCAHYYFYVRDPQVGFMHLRLQTWMPFTIHVCMNGREWLANDLRRAGIGFEKRDNCFVHIDDIAAAQALSDQQLRTDWSGLLNRLQQLLHSAHATMFGEQPSHPACKIWPLGIYWSADETEFATDVTFPPETLGRIYPQLARHAIMNFDSENVLRFLGRYPNVQCYRSSEIQTTLTKRPEGTCVKHRLNRNSIKMYDKQEAVLRIETTINDPRDMKEFRAKEGDPKGPKSWRRLRKGVADLRRRAKISQKSNERYLDALAAVNHDRPLGETVCDLCQPAKLKGRRVRALHLMDPDDSQLLAAVNRGEFAINGFRNRDLRSLLFGNQDVSPAKAKRQAARITRQIRMLRAHGLIKKVTKTHRYILTPAGQLKINAILAAQQASPQQLAQLAA